MVGDDPAKRDSAAADSPSPWPLRLAFLGIGFALGWGVYIAWDAPEALAQVLVLSVTAGIAAWYAFETRMMSASTRETAHQTAALAERTELLANETTRLADETGRMAQTSQQLADDTRAAMDLALTQLGFELTLVQTGEPGGGRSVRVTNQGPGTATRVAVSLARAGSGTCGPLAERYVWPPGHVEDLLAHGQFVGIEAFDIIGRHYSFEWVESGKGVWDKTRADRH